MTHHDPLQASLTKAIEMQFHEISDLAHHHSRDEAYAIKLWQQELVGTKRSNKSSNPNPPKRRRSSVSAQTFECSTCFETKRDRDVTNLDCCDTLYCRTCFQTWFETALNSKTIPKCCGQEIRVIEHEKLLKVAIRKKHAEVKDEVEADRKIYCSNPGCGRFIKVEDESIAFAQCKRCRRKTCVACGDALTAHGKKRKTCPNYLNDETLRQILNSNDWNRCPACFAPVEKTEGCNNIRCTCGTMFCFRCGDRKKGESDGCTCTKLPPQQHDLPMPMPWPMVTTRAEPAEVIDLSSAPESPSTAEPQPVESPMPETPKSSTVNPSDTMRDYANHHDRPSAFTNFRPVMFPNAFPTQLQVQVQDRPVYLNAELPSISTTDDVFGEDMDVFISWLASAHSVENSVW